MSQKQQRASSTSNPQTNLYSTAVNLPEESRVPVIQTLNQVLADTTDLRSQAKFAHWNVKGPDFFQLHLLFDEIAEELSEHVDLLAERATALGGQAVGTTRIAASTSRIPEPPVEAVDEVEYIEWLADHVGRHASFLREAIDQAAGLGDEDTADLLTEISREVDKQLYVLESHLQMEVRSQVPATMGQAQGTSAKGSTGQSLGGEEAASRSVSGSGSPTSQIEIQTGPPQAMAPAQGVPQDISAPISAPQSMPQDVAQPIEASQGSLQGGSRGVGQQQGSFQSQQRQRPPQQPPQQRPLQSQQQSQLPPQQTPQQQTPQQQGPQQQSQAPPQQQRPVPSQQQPPFGSQQQSQLPPQQTPQQQSQLPPQQQFPPQQTSQQPMSQSSGVYGGASSFESASSAFQEPPTQQRL
ncbi:DNA starvation/stationary phase protection protein Dps [Halobacterium wangiae]|uniref:DNA starvation/stationary phase protection protein Dps n=1 Tax=Halobacterium wangiae TaxID=2902623 RepID=UPI001E594B1D|nr:DNA starvation/stationary phase protection protein Dps [Halobacterium wangiae]